MDQGPEFGARQNAAELQRVRTQAAVFMVVASLAVGFIAGRASVWFAPFDSGRQSVAATEPVASQAAPAPRAIRSGSRELSPPPAPAMPAPDKAEPKPGEKPAAKGEAKAAVPGNAPAGLGPTSSDKEPAKAGDMASAPIENRASPDNSPPSPSVPADAGAASRAKRFTLINPGTANAGPDAQQPPTAGMRLDQAAADVEECERRYSSFRRSDGTYQPFDGGPRRRCPHLR